MMNWTGGRRSRHSHTNARSLAGIRKQHFAKARTKLQGRAHSASPFAEFISAVEGNGPRKQVNELGVSKDISSHSPHQQDSTKRRGDCRTGIRNVRPTSSKASENSAIARVILSELGRDNLVSRSRHIDSHGRKDSTAFSDRKRELLKRDDWVVTAVTRPLKITYSSAADGQRIGRHRRLIRHADRHVEFPRDGFVNTSGQQELTVQIGNKRASRTRERPFTGHVEIDMDESGYCKASPEPMLFDHGGPGHHEVPGCSPNSQETNMIISAYPQREVFTPSPMRLKDKQNGSFRHRFNSIISNQNVTTSNPWNEAMELGLQRNPHPEISSFGFLQEEKSLSEIWPVSASPGLSDCRSWMEDRDTATNTQSQYDNCLPLSNRMNSIHFAANRMNNPAHAHLGREITPMDNFPGNMLKFRMHKDLNHPDEPTNFFANKRNPRIRTESTPAIRTGLNTAERSKSQKVSSDGQYWKTWLSNVIGGGHDGSEADECMDRTFTKKLKVIYKESTRGIEEAPGSVLPEKSSQTPPLAEPVKQLFDTAPKWLKSSPERMDLDPLGWELTDMNGSLKLAGDSLHQDGIDEESRVWQRFVFADVQDDECIPGSPEPAAKWRSGTADDVQSDLSLAVLPQSVEASDISQRARPQTPSSGLLVSSSPLNVARRGHHHLYSRKFQTQAGNPPDCSEPGSDPETRSLQIIHKSLKSQASFVDNPVHSASMPNCADGSWPSSLENHFGYSRKDEVSPPELLVMKTHLATSGQATRSGKHNSRRRKLTFRKPQRFEGSQTKKTSTTKGNVYHHGLVKTAVGRSGSGHTTDTNSRTLPKKDCRKLSDLLFDELEDEWSESM